MCVSTAQASFSKTIVYAGQGWRDGELVHVLAYSNRPENRADGPNAMLLHMPGKGMTQQNVIPTDWCPNILRDIRDATIPRPIARSANIACDAAPMKRVAIFDYGIYTIVLAEDPRDIPAVLNRVPAEKRPSVRAELYNWYAQTFPCWPVALCCFNNRDAKDATPMMWWYDPMYPTALHAPGVDAHTGDVPDLGANVDRDHDVIFSVDGMKGGSLVRYTDNVPSSVARFLPVRAIGQSIAWRTTNGDFIGGVETIRDGHLPTTIGFL